MRRVGFKSKILAQLLRWSVMFAVMFAVMFESMVNVPVVEAQVDDPAAVEEHFSSAGITFDFSHVELIEILKLLAEELNLQLVVSGSVDQHLTIQVKNLDLHEALDLLLLAAELDHRIHAGVLTVAPANVLLQQDELRRRRRSDMMPLLTSFVQINYASADEILRLITDSKPDSDRSLLSDRGMATVDARTNTLIVHDSAERLTAVRQLVAELDRPLRQVLIEARVVSASVDTGRELGVRWGAMGMQRSAASAAQQEFDNTDAQGFWFDLVAGQRGASQAVLGVSRNSYLLELELSALESAGQAELIARPRVTTQDNTTAVIQSGVRIPYQAQAGGTAGGSTTEFVDALLSLEATPLITPAGRIIMRLNIRQDSVASGSNDVPAINTNTVTTRVLVNDGDTLVLGGIFRDEQTRSDQGTPLLQDLPLLGGFFRRQISASRRTELLIFITPQIVPEP